MPPPAPRYKRTLKRELRIATLEEAFLLSAPCRGRFSLSSNFSRSQRPANTSPPPPPERQGFARPTPPSSVHVPTFRSGHRGRRLSPARGRGTGTARSRRLSPHRPRGAHPTRTKRVEADGDWGRRASPPAGPQARPPPPDGTPKPAGSWALGGRRSLKLSPRGGPGAGKGAERSPRRGRRHQDALRPAARGPTPAPETPRKRTPFPPRAAHRGRRDPRAAAAAGHWLRLPRPREKRTVRA